MKSQPLYRSDANNSNTGEKYDDGKQRLQPPNPTDVYFKTVFLMDGLNPGNQITSRTNIGPCSCKNENGFINVTVPTQSFSRKYRQQRRGGKNDLWNECSWPDFIPLYFSFDYNSSSIIYGPLTTVLSPANAGRNPLCPPRLPVR